MMRLKTVPSLCCIAAMALSISWALAVSLPGDAIVATVNGSLISYSTIKVNEKVLVARFKRLHGYEPRSESDMLAIKTDRLKLEKENLRKSIRLTIRQQQITRFKISPTDKEVEERWKRWLNDREQEGELVDIDSMPDRQKIFIARVLSAIEDVVDKGQNIDTVYDHTLADVMSREEWYLRVKYDSSPERRQILRQSLDLSAKQLFDPYDIFFPIVVDEQLSKAIELDIAQADPEFAEYVQLIDSNPMDEKVQNKNAMYRIAKQHEWWKNKCRSANIVIKINRFTDIKNILLECR